MASNNQTYASTSAPLPSPSASQQPATQYFPQQRHHSSTSISQSQKPVPTSQPQSQQQQQHQSSQQPHKGAQQYGHDPYGKEKGYCVIAEAAKRAQLDVMMRDMGDVAL